MLNKTCLIYNYAQHYRKGIFKLLDSELKCDFYFGDKMSDVKKIEYKILNHFQKEIKNKIIKYPLYWQSDVIGLIFKPYKKYIMLGEYYCISTWVILILSKFSNKKVFLWTHGWYGNEGLLKKVVKKIFFKLSDGLFLYGTYAKKRMIKEGFNAGKLHVIYNSLDHEKQLSIRSKIKVTNIYKEYFKNTNPVVVFIGRLTAVKKLNYIIEIQKKLRKKNFFVNNVFIGAGDEMDNLKKLVSDYDLDAVNWFFGASYDENQIGELIYNADICLSPGNVGLTAIHSLVYGTPVITHDDFSNQMPEFEAIVPGLTGDFFKNDDIDSMQNTLYNWLNENKFRDATRANCFKRIDSYFNPNYQFQIIKEVLSE